MDRYNDAENSQELLNAIAHVQETGRSRCSTTLSKYLNKIKKNVQAPIKDKEKGSDKPDSGSESE